MSYKKKKAEENLIVARRAIADKHYNAAASRFYYALFLGVVAELEGCGWTLRAIDARLAEEAGDDHWPHKTVRMNCRKAGLNTQEVEVLKQMYNYRVVADYHPESVQYDFMAPVIERMQPIIDKLGIEPAQ